MSPRRVRDNRRMRRLRQIQNATSGQNYNRLAMSGLELTIAAICSDLLPAAVEKAHEQV